jgi:hypothetical protein
VTPDAILQGGAIAVFLLVFTAALAGQLRFKPGVDGQVKALEDALRDARDQRDRLVDAVEKLGDALEARNRRDEQVHREGK